MIGPRVCGELSPTVSPSLPQKKCICYLRTCLRERRGGVCVHPQVFAVSWGCLWDMSVYVKACSRGVSTKESVG